MYKHIIVLTCYDAENPYTDVVEKFFDDEDEAKKVVGKCVADELETLNDGNSGRRFAARFGYEGYAAAIFEDGAGTPTTVYDIVTVGETAMTKFTVSMMHYNVPEPYPDVIEKVFDDINEAKRTLCNPEKEVSYMTYRQKVNEEREEAWAEGYAQGYAESCAKGEQNVFRRAVTMLLRTHSVHEIAELLEVNAEEIQAIAGDILPGMNSEAS